MELRKVALTTVVISILIAVLLQVAFGVSAANLPYKIGGIATGISLFWLLFDKYLWQFKFFRLFGWMTSTPNLNGRWEGTVHRHGEAKSHGFAMEITQTNSKIKYYTYSKNSVGESIVCTLTADSLHHRFSLASIWKCKTKSLSTLGQYDDFTGASLMALHQEKDKMVLRDFYFTDRNPQTKGKLDLIWVGKERKGQL